MATSNTTNLAEELKDNSNWRWRRSLFGEDPRVMVLACDRAFFVQIPLDGKDSVIQDSELRVLLRNLVAAQQAFDIHAHYKHVDDIEPFIRDALMAIADDMSLVASLNEVVLPRNLCSIVSPNPLYYKLVPGKGRHSSLVERPRQHEDGFQDYDLAGPIDDRNCLLGHACSDPCTKPNALPHKHAPLFPDGGRPVPEYLDTDVMVVEKICGRYIAKVVVPEARLDEPMICKVVIDPYQTFNAVLREIQCLLAIANHNPPATSPLSRVPKLIGIVRSSVHGGVIGLLESFIPHRHEKDVEAGKANRDCSHRRLADQCLTYFDQAEVEVSRREKWIAQIHETIQALHEAGVTWGDVKSDNVLIHLETDDAWLIDFGGTGTHHSGDMELAETIEGDLALELQLADYLRMGKH
jgi:hypothetical protein